MPSKIRDSLRRSYAGGLGESQRRRFEEGGERRGEERRFSVSIFESVHPPKILSFCFNLNILLWKSLKVVYWGDPNRKEMIQKVDEFRMRMILR